MGNPLQRQGQIKVLGISGSPRAGNSQYLLERAIEAAKRVQPRIVKTDLYSFKGKKFGPCLGCFKCAQEKSYGECVIKDDFQNLRDLWLGSDVIIYSVPVYHVGIPGQLKCFIDRLGNTINKYYRLGSPRFLKVIGAIAQGMHFSAGQEMAINFLTQHAILKNCLPVSGDGWQSYIGASGWTVCSRDRDALKKHFEDSEADAQVAVQASQSLARRAVELAFILRSGGIGIKDFLQRDSSYKPFLERLPKGGKVANDVPHPD